MILTEHIPVKDAGLVCEAKEENGTKSLFMEGTFIVGDIKNLNERIYPTSEIKNAVQTINQIISNGESVLGECDHPQELTINLDRVSHIIEKMWMEGNIGKGRLKVVNTPHGQIIRTLVESGVKLGVSSRGSGNVNHRGEVSDFEIVTVDIVCKPSGKGCYPSPVYEAYNGRRGGLVSDLAEAARHDPVAQKYLKDELKSFIDKLG